MEMRAMAVYDIKAKMFGAPFFVPTRAAGVRAFSDVVNDGRSDYAKHPGDYTLHEVGKWDDATGLLAPLTPVEHVARASDLLEEK